MSFDTLDRWERTRRLGEGKLPAEAIDLLVRHYGEEHRAYHTLQHLGECFALLDRRSRELEDPLLLEVALWFHDAIYDPLAPDNEAKSADLAEAKLPNLKPHEHEELRRMILATRHSQGPVSGDAALLCDVDLAVLGAPEARYLEYEVQVRREYRQVPEEAYREGRGQLLRKILDADAIYATQEFRSEFDGPARRNLTRAIERLADPGTNLAVARW